MKNLCISFLAILIAVVFYNCNSTKSASATEVIKSSQIVCKVQSCGDSLSLYQFNGLTFKKLQTVAATGGETFIFNLPETKKAFYYIGKDDGQKKSVLVGADKELLMKGNCKNMRKSAVKGSAINDKYTALVNDITQNKSEMNQAMREYAQASAKKDSDGLTAASAKMAVVDEKRLVLLDTLKKTHPFLAKIAALETFLSFPNNKGYYSNDLDHYANEFFSSADLKDKDYERIPYVFEAFKQYSTTLSGIKIPEKQHAAYMDNALGKVPANSDTYKYALGGIIAGMQSKNHPNFVKYGSQFVKLYRAENTAGIADLEKKLTSAGAMLKGEAAPDFTMKTPEGKDMKLSKLRGKVVLVDFWASWCGPCRRENPHVVKLYNQYKDKGFDILGVSLDRRQESWVKAIEKDGLDWHHVSDLKGWSNSAARLYGVSSIPHTVLLDKEGRIIARNLRSPELAQQLKRIFD